MMIAIAGLLIELSADFEIVSQEVKAFETDVSGDPDVKVLYQGCENIEKPGTQLIYDEEVTLYKGERNDGSMIMCINGIWDEPGIHCRIDADKDWNHIRISYQKKIDSIQKSVISELGNLYLRNILPLKGGLLVHAAAVKYNGYGVLFSAPSGTGKSTHASLWEKHFGAVVINDDVPAVRLDQGTGKNEVIVYGTPWSGTRHKFANDQAPLKALVFLKQSKQNNISRLGKKEAVSLIIPRLMLPYYNDVLMNSALKHAERIVEEIPIYMLECRPDMEAAELCRRELFS
jgi:hypothetical protein